MRLLSLISVLLWPWLVRLGGPGLVLLGIADNSVVPLTGSMDVFTIWLAAAHPDIWPYYAFMATIGAVIGGYITYALGKEGGKEAIEHRFKKQRAEKVFRRFDRWGFRTIAVSALLPPPFPLVPILLAAGALQYSRQKFIGALTLGRSVRYFLLAGLGSLYGKQITAFFSQYYKPALFTLIGLAMLGGIAAFIEYRRLHGHRNQQQPAPSPHKAA